MKVALVHDYLNQYGGAERVLDELHAIWPGAPVYTAIYEPSRMPERYRTWDIRTSALNRLPFARRKHQALLPLLPHAFESFDLSDYDLVVSSSSGLAHGVLTGPSTLHVCYCHSPPRFLWRYHHYARTEALGRATRLLVEGSLPKLRMWDRVAAERADAWVATSRVIRDQIEGFYGKPSTVIPPPVNVRLFPVSKRSGSYFLLLMRLVGWKRPDIAVEACTRLGLPLVVAGDGRGLGDLKRIAGPSVRFVGRVGDDQIPALYRDCSALILPSEEDFGITPLEAMATGRPVIAFGRGGVLDTVVPGVTGIFFDTQTAESLVEALRAFDAGDFDPGTIRRHAEQFDSRVFAARLHRHIEGLRQSHEQAHAHAPLRAAGSPARPSPPEVSIQA